MKFIIPCFFLRGHTWDEPFTKGSPLRAYNPWWSVNQKCSRCGKEIERYRGVEQLRESEIGIKMSVLPKHMLNTLMEKLGNTYLPLVGLSNNAKDMNGRTALMRAVIADDLQHVYDLVNMDEVNINIRDYFGNSALDYAGKSVYYNCGDKWGKVNGMKVSLITLLVDKVHDQESKSKEHFHSMDVSIRKAQIRGLIGAAKQGNTDEVDYWLRFVEVNSLDEDGWTPLMHATQMNYFYTAKFLVGKGANIHVRNRQGKTAAMMISNDNRFYELLQ